MLHCAQMQKMAGLKEQKHLQTKNMSEFLPTKLLLHSSLLIFLICYVLSLTMRLSIFLSLSPIFLLLSVDYLSYKQLQTEMSRPYVPPLNTSAANGRAKMKQMTPRKTGSRYLIVGTGGVGKRIITMLHQRGETKVFGMDINENNMKKVLQDGSKRFVGDITNIDSCKAVIQKVQPDVIFHTAAVITFADRHAYQWDRTFQVNVKGVSNMLHASLEAPVKTFILTSSAVAGLNKNHIHSYVEGDEKSFPPASDRPNALSWYTLSKALAEEELNQFSKEHPRGPAVGIIRPASGIFHHDDPNNPAMEAFFNMSGFGPSSLRRVLDWVFCDNVVLGHLLLEKELNAGRCKGETFLISNGEPMSTFELFRRMKFLEPSNSFSVILVPQTIIWLFVQISEMMLHLGITPPGELKFLTSSTMDFGQINYVMNDDKAKSMLGYKPAFTVDEAILQLMEDHIKDYPDGALANSSRKLKKAWNDSFYRPSSQSFGDNIVQRSDQILSKPVMKIEEKNDGLDWAAAQFLQDLIVRLNDAEEEKSDIVNDLLLLQTHRNPMHLLKHNVFSNVSTKMHKRS